MATRGRRRTASTLGIAAGLLVIAGGIGYFCCYTVAEWQTALVTEFGSVQGDPVTEPGLHPKLPWQGVWRFDNRLLRWDGQQFTTVTADQKTVKVDVTARWRIDNALKFFSTIGSISQSGTRLKGIINDAVKTEISSHDLYEVVRSSNRVVGAAKQPEELVQEGEGKGKRIKVGELKTLARNLPKLPTNEAGEFTSGRSVVLKEMLVSARKSLKDTGFGIHLEDILIKQLTYTKAIEKNVYEQMNAELQKIAAGVRSRGHERAQTKLGEMEQKLDEIQSTAERKAEMIRGKAEAEAIRITAHAYRKDPDFFRFLRRLEAYRKSFGDNQTLVLGTDSPLFRLLKHFDADAAATRPSAPAP